MPTEDVWNMVIIFVHDGHVAQFVLGDAQANVHANQLQCRQRFKLYSRIWHLYSTIGIILPMEQRRKYKIKSIR